MRLIRSLIVAAAVVFTAAGGVVAAAPAQAHSGHWIEVYGGGYLRGQARFDGDWLQVCDRRVDGLRVRAHLESFTGTVYYSGWAPSGGCNREGHPTSITRFRVCVENYGCSNYHPRYG